MSVRFRCQRCEMTYTCFCTPVCRGTVHGLCVWCLRELKKWCEREIKKWETS